jgi:hypothetical protein
MRHVGATRTIPVSVAEVRAHLTPAAIVTYECGYEPKSVSTLGGRTVVVGEPAGRLLEPRYVFESDGDSYRYRRDDERPVAVAVEPTVELNAHNDTTEIRFRSTVTPRVPVPLVSRIVAWRRGRALSRVCDRLTDAFR